MTVIPAQSKPSQWPWKLYALILCWYMIRKVYILLSSQAPQSSFYFFLYSYHPVYYWPFFCNVAQTFLNLFHLAPLVFFIENRPVFTKEFWQVMFISKVIFDIVGHSYELNYLMSLWYYNPELFFLITVTSLGTYVPLYAACFLYAFRAE